MPTIDRPLHSDLLRHDLAGEVQAVRSGPAMASAGRNGRTLIKSGPLRVVLIALAPEGRIREHSADGPITIQSIEGTIVLEVNDERVTLEPGELVSLDGRVEHAVASPTGGVFLLTIALANQPMQGEER